MTTRRRKLWVLYSLRHGLQSLTASFLSEGMLGSDAAVLATFCLPPGSVPTTQLAQAFRVLTVALVVTTWLVFARAPFAQTIAGARPAPSGTTAMLSRTLASAHGSFDLPRESSG